MVGNKHPPPVHSGSIYSLIVVVGHLRMAWALLQVCAPCHSPEGLGQRGSRSVGPHAPGRGQELKRTHSTSQASSEPLVRHAVALSTHIARAAASSAAWLNSTESRSDVSFAVNHSKAAGEGRIVNQMNSLDFRRSPGN